MPDITSKEIWIYIYEKGEVRSKDLERQFEKTKLLSHGTVYKYKRDLEIEGKIKAKLIPNARPPHYVFYVPKRFHGKLEAMVQKRKLDSMLNNLSSEEQITTISIWSEIEMVVRSMKKMGYSTEEIHAIFERSFEELHSSLVDRIVKDAEKEES